MTAPGIAALALSTAALAFALVSLVVATRPGQPRHLAPPAGYTSPDGPAADLPKVPHGPAPGARPRTYCGQLAPTVLGRSEPCTLEPHPGSPMHEADNGMRWWFYPGVAQGQPSGVVTCDAPLTEQESARLTARLTARLASQTTQMPVDWDAATASIPPPTVRLAPMSRPYADTPEGTQP